MAGQQSHTPPSDQTPGERGLPKLTGESVSSSTRVGDAPVSVRGGWPGPAGLAGRVGAGSSASAVTREAHDPFGVSCPGFAWRVLGAGASPLATPRWLNQKHVRHRNQDRGGLAHHMPAS